MNPPAAITDNLTEMLVKIIEFTQARQKVLVNNINGIYEDRFVPQDLPTHEFACVMSDAIEEYARSRRLLLRDGESVKFGASGCFDAQAIIDGQALKLFEKDRNEYLQLQIDKLLENSLNQRIATELLRLRLGDEVSYQLNLN